MRSTDWRRALLLGQVSTLMAGFLLPGTTSAQEGPFVYVPNRGADSVSLIDIPIGTVQPGTIAVGFGPIYAGVTGDQSRVYVANAFANSVSVIDTATDTVLATIPAGALPQSLALSPDGTRAYVNNAASNDVSVIDTATNAVIATIPVGIFPSGVAFSPDGTQAYVTNRFSSSLSVIDTATNAVTATLNLFSIPIGVDFSPDGSRAMVINAGTDTVSVINTATTTIVTTIPVGPSPFTVTFSPDGVRAYVTIGNDTVSVIDTASNTVIATIPVGSTPVDVNISPDGTRAYVSNLNSNTVSVIDTASNLVIATLGGFAGPNGAAVCSNGNAMLTAGHTFRANNGGAIACTMTGPGTGPVFTGGTMQIRGASISSALPVLLAVQGGTIDTQANTAAFSGVILGPGALTKIGTGTLVLSGNNSYFGATLINQGTLRAGATGTFSSDSAMNVAAGAVLDLAGFDQEIGSLAGAGNVVLGAGRLTTGGDGTSTSFSGVISGSGGLTKTGGGVFTLSGANTYSGQTTVDEGTLTITATGSIKSSVVNNAVFNVDGTVSGNLVSNGGTATIDGTLGGTASVKGGLLVANGTIGGLVTIADNAVLKGNGTLGGLVLTGTMAPGNSIGTLQVAGNAKIGAGSIYQVEINAAGKSDRLAVIGAVTLGGGEVVVLGAPGAYAAGQTYTIITAGGGVAGTFAGVSDDLALLDAALSYQPSGVLLTLERSTHSIASFGLTPNQKATGGGIDSLGGGTLDTALTALSAADIPAALDLLSGEIHASIKSAFIEESRYLRDASSDRIRDAFGAVGARPLPVMGYAESGPVAADADAPLAMWGQAFGAPGAPLTATGTPPTSTAAPAAC
jgi:YVTN family beta-propeller protein/autotransporter-associated beta strand protein